MDITLRFDSLAAIMSVLVLAIGALVLFYCAEYFHHHEGRIEKRLPSFAAELVAFSGAMFGLVISDNMLVLYIFWETTTVLSFLLVEPLRRTRHQPPRRDPGAAGDDLRRAGDAGGHHHPGQPCRAPICSPSSSPHRRPALAATIGIALILVGALSKSAIVPLHFWLPGAMAAPDSGQRLPARRRDGEGRRLPGGPR